MHYGAGASPANAFRRKASCWTASAVKHLACTATLLSSRI